MEHNWSAAMIEPLLKSQLEPVAQRQRRWRITRSLALWWGLVALAGISAWLGQRFCGLQLPYAFSLIGGAAVIGTFVAWDRASRWSPDFRQIARDIEQRHPDLHALLLTAVEQSPDPATGRLNFLQERVVQEAVAAGGKHRWVELVSDGQLALARCGQVTALILMVLALVGLRLPGTRPAAAIHRS